MSYVGSRVGRLEDPRLLTGAGRFADDQDRPGQLWMRVVRSQVAHAMLGAVDTSGALALDGIRAVLTAADVILPPIPVRVSPDPSDLLAYLQPVLPQGRVRYVGEPVAVVVADDPYQAEDGADLVAIDYAELAPVRDARAACGPGTQQLFHRLPNEVAVVTASFGDVAAAFRDAAHVVELDVVIGRQTAVPIEPRPMTEARVRPRTGRAFANVCQSVSSHSSLRQPERRRSSAKARASVWAVISGRQ